MAKIVGIRTSSMNEWCSSQLQDLCRLCGKYNIKMLRIFDEKNKHDFSKIINMHFSDFQVTESDALPVKLCSQCVASLLAWHEFYVSCININKCFHAVQEKLRGKGSVQQENVVPANEIAQQKSANESEGAPVIEVIEIKMDVDDEPENDIYEEVPEYGDEHFDIANIPISEDASVTVVDHDERSNEDSVKEEKLDTEEMAILENDLKVTTYGFEHLNETCTDALVEQTTSINSTHASPKSEQQDVSVSSGDEILSAFTNQTKSVIDDAEDSTEESKKEVLKKVQRRRLRICHLCGKHYTTDSGFRHHMVMHRDPSFSCHMCGRVFWESQNLKKHLAALHSEDRPFQCHMCGMKYKRRDVLQEHIKRVHDGIKKQWNEQMIRKYRSSGNTKTEVKKDRFQCPHCNKCMASKGYLEDHINGAHVKEPLYKCDQCAMTFTRKASFRYHFKRAHVQKKRILEPRGTFLQDCEFCGLQFRIKKYYDLHVAAKHLNKHPCEHCGEVFNNKGQRIAHIDSVHADEIAKCQICHKTFPEAEHLKRHIYLCHTERKPYECHTCGHKANKKSTLAVHMRRHTGEKPYQCDRCPRRFSQSVDYRKHRANHFKRRTEEHDADMKKTVECALETEEIGLSIECVGDGEKLDFEAIKTGNVHFM